MTLRAALAWVAREVGPGSRVTSCRVLKGGLTSAVHAVNVIDRSGSIHRLVLRRWAHEGVGQSTSNVEREVRILDAVRASAIPTPELVAADANADEPAVLMTRLLGRIDLDPSDPDDWLRQMATTLFQIPLQVAGRIPVDVEGMSERVEETLARALRRVE
jgi:aminoglycoside phosphotransferase (APT) family kinase protein